MTNKQIKKLADRMTQLELIHLNASSKEERREAEKQMMQLGNMIGALPNGLEIMDKLDSLIQDNLAKSEI